MRLRLALPLVGLLVALGGCGGDASTTPTSGGSGDGPLVTYTKSGGFAPILQTIVIERDGAATVKTGYPADTGGKRVRFELEQEELESLRKAIEATTLEKESAQTACADCFVYEVETANGDVSFDDSELSGVGDQPPTVPADVSDLNRRLESILFEQVPDPPAIGG